MSVQTIPLFPLQVVLFPGGPLPLRVFEPRYLDMVSNCMKNSVPFGVLLLDTDQQRGVASMRAIGTLASIVDWYQGTDGLLGITAMGSERFRLLGVEQQADGLSLGAVEVLPPEPELPLPADYAPMAALLRAVIDDLGRLYETIDKHYGDASWVGYRFAEVLPLELNEKQQLLELDDPIERLRILRPLLRQLREEQTQ
jgi:Lon protease-like protein